MAFKESWLRFLKIERVFILGLEIMELALLLTFIIGLDYASI
jgi:hypothetical protein